MLLATLAAPVRKSRRCRIIWAHIRAQGYLLRRLFSLKPPVESLFVGYNAAGRQCFIAATSGSLLTPKDNPLVIHKVFYQEGL